MAGFISFGQVAGAFVDSLKSNVLLCALSFVLISAGVSNVSLYIFSPCCFNVTNGISLKSTSILTMTDLSDWHSQRRNDFTQLQGEKTSPGPSLSKSPSNQASADSSYEVLEQTPRRSNRRVKPIQEQCLTSTPVKASSLKILSNLTRQCSKVQKISVSKSLRKKSKPRQSLTKQSCISTNQSKHGSNTTKQHFKEQTQRFRPTLNLDSSSSGEQDESLPSSDLSIELSIHEEPQLQDSIQEEEDSQEEEDEDFPSFLIKTKSLSITEGGFVWYKLRKFPFWPAMVKSVNHKMKRASILLVDETLIRQQKRGFLVALKTLKPYECEEFNELICKAKEKYDVAIQWSVDLIEDYIMRKGVGSFSGSFLEYYSHNISHPVRRKYQANVEMLTFANDVVMEGSLPADDLEESLNEQEDNRKHLKRLLPDRTHAAHNRANEKLVQFIVKQGMVDKHLVAIMCGQQQSKWLQLFLSTRRRRVVNIYLEDDDQLDLVYKYLCELYTTTAQSDACFERIKSIHHVPFVLDVLLPEAIIHAIAGVDKISLLKAEEKYMTGRRITNRERQEFDMMIEQQKT